MTDVCVVDIAYGDAGKGAVVDRICAQGDVGVVVRWNGGCQAQHNVLQDDGRHHTFSQFGSGSFHGVPTYLATPVMVEPLSMLTEATALAQQLGYDPMHLVHVSPHCRLTTPYHWLVNRWQEDQRGDARHGSCGRGIGMTAKFSIDNPAAAPRVRDILHLPTLRDKLVRLGIWASVQTNGDVGYRSVDVDQLVSDYVAWSKLIQQADAGIVHNLAGEGKRVVFEGAQGVLLDEHWGWHPHTTWSEVTPDWVRKTYTGGPWARELEVVGVTRAYTTRHGAGPFVAEDASLNLPEGHNRDEHYQGAWRVGHFDLPAVQYGARAAQVDSIYVTHLDTADAEPQLQVCESYVLDDTTTIEPLSLLAWDFKSRMAQTSRLMRAKPELIDNPFYSWGDCISYMLGLPLYGVGRGPRTSDGSFLVPVTG